jgi:hypothetical protein
MPARKLKAEDTAEARVIKLISHRQEVSKILGDTDYSLGYLDGVTAAIKIVAGVADIERAIVSARVETREQ